MNAQTIARTIRDADVANAVATETVNTESHRANGPMASTADCAALRRYNTLQCTTN
jgi:hypothetical protein